MSLQTVSDVTLVRVLPIFFALRSASGPNLPFDVPVRKAPLRLCHKISHTQNSNFFYVTFLRADPYPHKKSNRYLDKRMPID